MGHAMTFLDLAVRRAREAALRISTAYLNSWIHWPKHQRQTGSMEPIEDCNMARAPVVWCCA